MMWSTKCCEVYFNFKIMMFDSDTFINVDSSSDQPVFLIQMASSVPSIKYLFIG